MKEQDLVLVSAAVYAYLQDERTEELKNVKTEEHDVLKSLSPLVSSLKHKRNRWKWSFAPRQNANPAILRDNWLVTSRWTNSQ